MEQNDHWEKLIDYLYGELSPVEKSAFLHDLKKDSELSGDLKSYLQLRQVFHEQLPHLKAPRHLTKKVFIELGLRKPWYQSFTTGFWRPAMAGAFAVLLTLGITSQWGKWNQPNPTPLATPESSFVATGPTYHSSESEFSDRFLVNGRLEHRLRVPGRSGVSGVSYPGSGNLVSMAGYGGNTQLETPGLVPESEIHRLNVEAEQAVAQFLHQQALRMRAVGDFKGAAQELAHLIKTYPFYPFKLQAMAQRVDSLFRAGDFTTARSELKVLNELTPTLSYLIERRWGTEPTE